MAQKTKKLVEKIQCDTCSHQFTVEQFKEFKRWQIEDLKIQSDQRLCIHCLAELYQKEQPNLISNSSNLHILHYSNESSHDD